MIDLRQTLLWGPKTCHACGQLNFKGDRFCIRCGERISNRNPVLRFFITIVAMGIVVLVCWWKLTR